MEKVDGMRTVNDYQGNTDSDVIENALRNLDGRTLVIPSRVSSVESERHYWLLDRAILLPSDITVVLQNCKIKLSDKCRDNFFRSANCGLNINDPKPLRNIHIRGEGLCILEGADHPRATGDETKKLKCPCPHLPEDVCVMADWVPENRRVSGKLEFMDIHGYSYGTDAGKEEESQYGDWRNIGILFANVQDFSIENLKIVDAHGWAISLEECNHGRIERIEFDMCMSKQIDGVCSNIENQDGIDVRNGCNNIIISDITGGTGDDVIALTAIACPQYYPGGSLRYTHVMHSDWNRRGRDIQNIIIKNISAYCKSGICSLIRLLPAYASIRNIIINGIVDIAPLGSHKCCTLLFGEIDGAYGKNEPGSISGITVSNVISGGNGVVDVRGYLCNSSFSNIINCNTEYAVFNIFRENGVMNTAVSSITSASGKTWRYYQWGEEKNKKY